MTAYDIYQELMALPESRLAEVQQLIELIKYKTVPQSKQSTVNDFDAFFSTYAPLNSFESVNPTEYVDNLRSKSRLLQEDK